MCHVLIIEDEAIAAADIESVLRRVGATSFAFADTERGAVNEARLNPPAVIISDVMLANGSGPGAVRTIAASLGHVPVIFVTAVPSEVDDIPHVLVLDKPFYAAQLAAAFVAVAPV